ncbi:MAG: hypothetical protein R3F59_24125, partial [Myxococcota bacterium]
MEHPLRYAATPAERCALYEAALAPPPPDPRLAAALHLGRGRIALAAGPTPDRVAHLTRAAALGAEHGAPELAAEALTAWAQSVHLTSWGPGSGALALAERACEAAPVPRAVALRAVLRAHAGAALDREAVRSAVVACGGRVRMRFDVAVLTVGAALAAGDVAFSAELRALADDAARTLGDPVRIAAVQVLAAQDAGHAGRIDDCIAALEGALPVLRAHRVDGLVLRARTLLLTARSHLGHHALAEALCDALVAERTLAGDAAGRRACQCDRCLLLLDQGRVAAAEALYRDLRADADPSPPLRRDLAVVGALLALAGAEPADAVAAVVRGLDGPPDPRTRLRLDAIAAVARVLDGRPPGTVDPTGGG